MAKPGHVPTPRARTPQQLARQEKAFAMSLEGMSIRAIAAELKIDKDTAQKDIRLEEALKADENAARRENDKARSLAFYDVIINRALKRAAISDEILVQIRDGSECEKKVSDRSFEAALKAQERKDKLLGLDAPTKVDLAVQGLVEALTAIPEDAPLFPSDPTAT